MSSPGKSYRTGISLVELMEMFPDEQTATQWFELTQWPTGRVCGHCGSCKTKIATHNKMPYWCTDCRSYFSVRTGTMLESTRVPLRKWAIAIYLYSTNIKGVSSMKLHRDIKVTQKTSWFMLHRIRDSFPADLEEGMFSGPVEVDETYIGGKRKNMSNAQRKALKDTGRGAVGKTAVVGVKDRKGKQIKAKVVTKTDKPTLQGFIADSVSKDATVYTDEHNTHQTVNHGISECERTSPHKRHRIVLEPSQARILRYLPPHEPKAP